VILELPTTLAERYHVTRYLGAGAFAETYAAQDGETGQDVAVKVLRPQFVDDQNTLARFEREAQATSEIIHPNVVRTLDFSMGAPHPFLVMEYVPGPDLKALLNEHRRFTQEQAVTYAVQLLAGLNAIHLTGMVHRDVKPHNVLTDPELGARLSDFGIARALHQPGLTRTGIALGTASYMAPEQATGTEVTPSSDVYAVGVMLFEMLTGQTPFSGDDPLEVLYKQVHEAPPPLRELDPEIPGWLERITLRAMSKDPADRYASADAMIQALNSANGATDETRVMDPALLAAQAATAAMPAQPASARRAPRDQRAVPPVPPAAPRGRRSEPARRKSNWYRTPVFLLLALVLIVAAVGALYALGPGESPADDDDETTTVIDEPADDEVPEEEIEPEAPDPPAEEEQPAEPEAPEEAPDPVPADDPVPEPEDEQEVPEEEIEDELEDEEDNDQGQGQGQGNGNPGQGQGDNPPGQSDDNPGQGQSQGQGQNDDNPGQGNT
jgi:eukaryotic-like serine/threonine-protein kinase